MADTTENMVNDFQERVKNLEDQIRYLETKFENEIWRIDDLIREIESKSDRT